MNVGIVRIADRGQPNRERLHLHVHQPTNLAFYVALITHYQNADAIATGHLTAFWFPSQDVRPGDSVVLFSGSGQPQQKLEPNGSTTYYYYWGLPNTIWHHPANCVMVVEAATWQTSPYGS
jgi:hypothetical protein